MRAENAQGQAGAHLRPEHEKASQKPHKSAYKNWGFTQPVASVESGDFSQFQYVHPTQALDWRLVNVLDCQVRVSQLHFLKPVPELRNILICTILYLLQWRYSELAGQRTGHCCGHLFTCCGHAGWRCSCGIPGRQRNTGSLMLCGTGREAAPQVGGLARSRPAGLQSDASCCAMLCRCAWEVCTCHNARISLDAEPDGLSTMSEGAVVTRVPCESWRTLASRIVCSPDISRYQYLSPENWSRQSDLDHKYREKSSNPTSPCMRLCLTAAYLFFTGSWLCH